MKKTAKEIVALAMPPATGKTNYKIVEGNDFLLITPEIFRMCKNKELSEVEFVENGTLETKDGKELKSWKVSSFEESERVLLDEKTELDMAKVDAKYKVLAHEATYKEKLSKLGVKL